MHITLIIQVRQYTREEYYRSISRGNILVRIYLASDYGFYLMIIQIKAISNYSIQHPGEAQEPDQQYWTKALSKQRTVSYLVASSNHAHH